MELMRAARPTNIPFLHVAVHCFRPVVVVVVKEKMMVVMVGDVIENLDVVDSEFVEFKVVVVVDFVVD